VVHGPDKLRAAVAATSAILTAAGAMTAHSLRSAAGAARLILLSFAAPVAATSPIAGVLWLVWSFIHPDSLKIFHHGDTEARKNRKFDFVIRG